MNIYPQEIDNELIKHDGGRGQLHRGVPHAEWGEQVKAVILLKEGYRPSDALAQEILAFASDKPAGVQGPAQRGFRPRTAEIRGR